MAVVTEFAVGIKVVESEVQEHLKEHCAKCGVELTTDTRSVACFCHCYECHNPGNGPDLPHTRLSYAGFLGVVEKMKTR